MTRPPPLVAPPGPVAPNMRGLARFVVFVFAGVAYCLRIWSARIVGKLDVRDGLDQRMALCRTLVRVLGIDVELQSPPPLRAELVIPNHRSYVDVAVVLARVRGAVVSKSEVARWPLIGTVAQATGTVFVVRDSPESRKLTRARITELAMGGTSVILYAEGSTGIGPGLLPMKPGPFAIAAEHDLAILPVALEYEFQSDSWVGDDTFVRHFLECFSKRRTRVTLRFGPVLRDVDGESLKERTVAWLESNLREMRAAWDVRRAPSGSRNRVVR